MLKVSQKINGLSAWLDKPKFMNISKSSFELIFLLPFLIDVQGFENGGLFPPNFQRPPKALGILSH